MDPLSQLQDIHLPEQINNYPLAYGWWILAAILLSLTLWLVRRLLKKRQLNQAKKQAVNLLVNTELASDEIFATVKWAALQYFPRQQVANLYGEDLQRFLTITLPKKQQQNFASLWQSAIEHQYKLEQDDTDISSLKTAALSWLKLALPPKNTLEYIENQHEQDSREQESIKQDNISTSNKASETA